MTQAPLEQVDAAIVPLEQGLLRGALEVRHVYLHVGALADAVEAPDAAYPWNAVTVVDDTTMDTSRLPANLREADRAYYNYAVQRMRVVRWGDPDVSCDSLLAQEEKVVGSFIDGWILSRTLFGAPPFEPLDELVFARRAGLLRPLLARRSDPQVGACAGQWADENPERIAAYERMANLATRAGVEGRGELTIHAPLLELTKAEIIRRGLKFEWVANTRADCVDYPLLKHMHRAGCRRIYYGWESGSQRMLDVLVVSRHGAVQHVACLAGAHMRGDGLAGSRNQLQKALLVHLVDERRHHTGIEPLTSHGGYLLEGFSTRSLLMVSTLVMAAAGLWLWAQPEYGNWMLARALQGLALPALMTAVMTMLSVSVPREARALSAAPRTILFVSLNSTSSAALISALSNFLSRLIRWILITGSRPPMRAIRSGTISGRIMRSMILNTAAFSLTSRS